jgi:hypothetical protein
MAYEIDQHGIDARIAQIIADNTLQETASAPAKGVSENRRPAGAAHRLAKAAAKAADGAGGR